MAKLINGDGNTAVYASEDADLIASLAGNVTGIAKLGNQFAYELADANTIEVKDGVIITQEGRRVQLDVNAVDIFEIPNGVQGDTNYYIIGYKLETDAESKQTATTFVQLMDNGTDTIPEGTFRGGDTDVYISLYRVTQDGLSITDVDLLLPVLDNISELKSALTGRFTGLTLRKTTSANVTFAAQLTEIEAVYSQLSQVEKERAIIVRDDITFTSDREGYFIAFRGNASNIQAFSYDISNKKYHIWTIATSGNTVSDNSSSTSNVALLLYA